MAYNCFHSLHQPLEWRSLSPSCSLYIFKAELFGKKVDIFVLSLPLWALFSDTGRTYPLFKINTATLPPLVARICQSGQKASFTMLVLLGHKL